jgi:hypothetical protein
MMKRLYAAMMILALSSTAGCYYTAHSVSGPRVTSAQVQELKVGQTTEMDLLRILGEPTKKDVNPLGMKTCLYGHAEIQSMTLPWGYVMHGLLDRQQEEVFEVVLKDGVVQTYQFLRR